MDLNSDDDFPSDLDDDGLGDDLSDEAEGSGTSTLDDDAEDSDLDDQSDLNDAFDDLSDISEDEEDDEHPLRKKKRKDSEADYETSGRSRWTAAPLKPEEDSVEVGRLPIKLPTGEVQTVEGSTRIALPPSKKKKVVVESETEEELEEEDEDSDDGADAKRMASNKGRFGRMGVAEIVGMKGAKNAEKLGLAKEQIAQIGAEILAGGELIDIVSRTWCTPQRAVSDFLGTSLDSTFYFRPSYSPIARRRRRTTTRPQLDPRSGIPISIGCLQRSHSWIPN